MYLLCTLDNVQVKFHDDRMSIILIRIFALFVLCISKGKHAKKVSANSNIYTKTPSYSQKFSNNTE